MAAVTGTVTRAFPQENMAVLMVTVPSTTDSADTVAIDLRGAGIGVFIGCIAFEHSTTGSVVISGSTNQPTTAVSAAGVLTLTVAEAGTNKAQAYIIYGLGANDTNITAP